jgi:hypothetical protein
MSKDRSLDDFVGADSDAEHADSGERDDDAQHADGVERNADHESPDATDTEEAVDTDAVTPATPTYRFTPDGAACDACGDTVEKRWHDDGRFVCADCKEW